MGSATQTIAMKNFFILLIALFLAYRVLGQDSSPALQYTKFETPEIYPELTSRNLIRHHPNQQHALIQIYDSLYYWRWDTITIGWKNSYKAIDMVYDGNNGHISIFNLSGQQLLQQEITEPKTSVDVSGFKSGVYIVRLTDDKTVRVQKFVKH